jgi:hypothetical protein
LNRNVKDISFSKIKTNKDFEEAIRCVEYEGKSLSFENTIIVAEDIDCANMDVIRTRSNARHLSCDDASIETVNDTSEDDDNLDSETDDVSSASCKGGLKKELRDKQADGESGVKTIVEAMTQMYKMDRSSYVKTEKEMKASAESLDLSTILNIMDGVKSLNGRIIVFTTNHPEKIDPALLRPGRIDLDVRFGPIGKELIHDMCRFWYVKYSEFYGEPEILTRFDTAWRTVSESFMDTRMIRPCVVHNILQKHGKNVEEAVNELVCEM